jgi:hypothetical protein
MKANTVELDDIFDPNVFFQVPLFQRPYVWNEEVNWEPLWEDIQALLDRRLRTGNSRAHFLGAVVLEQLRSEAGTMETRLVIDGQQRFTTLQLFLMAARNLANQHGAKRLAATFTGLVENDENRVRNPNEKFKLWPTNSDRLAFKTIHACRSLDELDKTLKAKRELLGSNLVGAYRYFHGKLAEWLAGELDDEDDKPALAHLTPEDRLEVLWQVVDSGLQLVVINLDEQDETQVIFETLNARGTDLLPADLIKNYLFRRAQNEGANVEDLYGNHWERFETEFWRNEIKQGRITRPRIDLFINHYLSLMTLDEVKTTHLFQAFKSFAEQGQPAAGASLPYPKDAAGHIEQLARYADVFLALQDPKKHPVLETFMRRLEAVDTATVYPLLLHAYATFMPHDQAAFDRVLGVLESFLMRRLITGATPKNYNRLFIDLIRAVEKAGGVSAQTIAEQLAKGSGDSTKFPTNEELLVAVFEQPMYDRMTRPRVRAVLEALDAAAQSDKSEVLPLPTNLTIEHVMPQTWETHWPLPDEAKIDALTEQKAAARRSVMLNTLGNLTLITGKFNSSLQNAAWTSKRPELLTYAKLNLTQYFHGAAADTWDEAAIRLRTEHLFKQLLKIWPDIERPKPAAT